MIVAHRAEEGLPVAGSARLSAVGAVDADPAVAGALLEAQAAVLVDLVVATGSRWVGDTPAFVETHRVGPRRHPRRRLRS